MERVKHEDVKLASKSYQEAFQEVVSQDDQWMAVIWRVKDGQLEIVRCTTWKFPFGDYPIAAKQLAGLGEEEKKSVNQVEEPAPLPKLHLPKMNFLRDAMKGNEDG